MRAALDALAQLNPGSLQGGGVSVSSDNSATAGNSSKSSTTTDDLFAVDSRSVRVAIEQDALQQALLLQEELRTLLNTVRQLREGVSDTAALARRVDEVVRSNVMTASVQTTMAAAAAAAEERDTNIMVLENSSGNLLSAMASTNPSSSEAALEEEQKLATVLSDCFSRRSIARQRVAAVHEFLERFDLSEDQSRLLDHYSFEDVNNSGAASNYVNGTAFLAALERVRIIRAELGKTFGSMDAGGMMLPGPKRLSHVSASSAMGSGGGASSMSSSSALRMMETLAQKQERAYERLYHWLQKYLQLHNHEHGGMGSGNNGTMSSDDEDLMDEALSHPFVRRSLKTLRNVPAFYSHLLELIAQSRRSEETRRFLLALTSGYGGMPPIEMRAHDSVVYIGDMLAFCFRAFNVEADVARGLLKLESDVEEEGEDDGAEGGEGTARAQSNEEDEREHAEYGTEQPISATEMLMQSMGGLSRPLKSRILQVISTLARRPDDEDGESDDGMNDLDEEGASARAQLSQLYEICGLLLFYASAIEKAIRKLQASTTSSSPGTESSNEEMNPLLVSIFDCLDEATTAYGASLRVYGAMLEQLTMLTGDPEASLAHAMIVRVVDVRKASPGFVDDVECPEKYRQTLSLDWSCGVLVEAALPSCKTLDDAVALKQSIAVARQGGLSELKALSLEEDLREQETALIEQVVAKEATDVLDLCGLGPLATAWDRFEGVRVEGMTMASYPGMSSDEAESSMKEFYSSLYSPPIPSFENSIKDPSLRKLARSKIAKTVCDKYAALYEAMSNPEKGGYDDLSFLGHTPSQVVTLFQV